MSGSKYTRPRQEVGCYVTDMAWTWGTKGGRGEEEEEEGALPQRLYHAGHKRPLWNHIITATTQHVHPCLCSQLASEVRINPVSNRPATSLDCLSRHATSPPSTAIHSYPYPLQKKKKKKKTILLQLQKYPATHPPTLKNKNKKKRHATSTAVQIYPATPPIKKL